MSKQRVIIASACVVALIVGVTTWWRASHSGASPGSPGTYSNASSPSIPASDVEGRFASLPIELQQLLLRTVDKKQRELGIHCSYAMVIGVREPRDVEIFLELLERADPSVADRDAQTERGSASIFNTMRVLQVLAFAWHQIGPIPEAEDRVNHIIQRLKNHRQKEVRGPLLCLLRLMREKDPSASPTRESHDALIAKLETEPGVTQLADTLKATLEAGP
jgi:hypothetical protein